MTTTATPQQPGPATTVPSGYELLQRLKAVAPEFAQEAEAKGRFKTLPPRKAMADLVTPPRDAPDELIKDRFLCRGGAALVAANTGKGKSSLTRQIAVCWAAGLPIFGMTPTRPLRQLIIQAENDEGDEARFRDGVARCPYRPPLPAGQEEQDAPGPLPPDVFARAARQIVVARCVDQFGPGFLETLRALVEADGPFDIVWVDPLLAFLGGDVSDQKTMSPFLRNGLAPLMIKFNLAVILIHHTPKPIRTTSRDFRATDMGAYLGMGSAELANWPRAVLALETTAHRGVFRLRAAKRHGALGWRDPQTGELTDSRYLAHSTDGSIYWREPLQDELQEALEEGKTTNGRTEVKASVQDVVDLLIDAGGEVVYSDLRDMVMGKTGCSRSWASRMLTNAIEEGVARKRGSCPAFYKVTGKAQRSNFNPITGSGKGQFKA